MNPMISILRDGYHNLGSEAVTFVATAAPTAEEKKDLVRDWTATLLIVGLLFGLLFVTFFVMAMHRRRRRLAALRSKEAAPLQDAWAVAGERAEPFEQSGDQNDN